MSRGKDKEEQIVLDLAQLLRKNGDRILRGDSKLALTTQSLSVLNRAFRRHSESQNDDNSRGIQSTSEWRNSINYLKDFLQRAVSVKIIHGSYTMQGPIHLARFRTLQVLEIKKVPIHMLEGLQYLRGQLRTIIINRSLQAVHELFETCGGDMTSPMTWPELTAAYLSHNTISQLDTSLRLLQSVDTLDLSHNIIERTESHLECMTGLIRVSFGSNYLVHPPSFSLTTRGRLKTLVLRNNNLENIEGLEELVVLEELDVSENFLTFHSCLHVLSGLNNLNLLCVQGNPLSYHSKHRILTIKQLSPFAGKKMFILDSKALMESEILVLKSNKVSMSRRPSHEVHSIITRAQVEDRISGYYSFDESDGIATSVPVSQGQITPGRKKMKKKTHVNKAWKTDISDLDSSTLEGSSFDSFKVSSLVRDGSTSGLTSLAREESPPMRTKQDYEVLREHYGPNWLQVISSEQTTSATIEAQSSPLSQTQDDIYLNEKMEVLPKPKDEEITPQTPPSVDLNIDPDKELSVHVTHPEADKVYEPRSDSEEEGEKETEKEEALGNESDPFIVTLTTKDDSQLIVTVTDRYLVEKDLNGCFVDKLDLKCLETLTRTVETSHDKDENEDITFPLIKLTFDYVKKDRRARSYGMEDALMAAEFENLLRPFIQALELKQKIDGQLQCLKCSHKFSKKVVLHPRRSSLAVDNTEHGDQESCPKCQSEMVVKMDNHSSEQGSMLAIPKQVLENRRASLPVSIAARKLQKSPTPSPTQKKNSRRSSLQPRSFVQPTVGSIEESSRDAGTNSIQSSEFISGVPLARSTPLTARKSTEGNSTTVIEVEAESRLSNLPQETRGAALLRTSSDSTLRSKSDIGQSALKRGSWSEITQILSAKGVPCGTPSVDSDITILANPSESSVTAASEISLGVPAGKASSVGLPTRLSSVSLEAIEENSQVEKNNPNVKESSPLSDSVRNSIVSSIYESSRLVEEEEDTGSTELAEVRGEGGEAHIYDMEEEPSLDTAGLILKTASQINGNGFHESNHSDDIDGSQGDNDDADDKHLEDIDFTKVDHRIKLHLAMSLLEDGEDCLCMLKCDIVQYQILKAISGVMIVTSKKILIFKITDHTESEKIDHWLQSIEKQPITELQYIDIGLGYQSIRLEFGAQCSCFTLLIRDEGRCKKFIELLTGIVQGTAFHNHSKLQAISKVNPTTLENLDTQVLQGELTGETTTESDCCPHLVKYLTGILITPSDEKKSVGLVISPSAITLVQENYQWPLPHLQTPSMKTGLDPQFTVVERQKIDNIASVEVNEENPKQLRLIFFNEESQEEASWHIAMETVSGVSSLVESVRGPWEAEFGVELDVMPVVFS
ncbi:hypothetical protein ScPMuIL_011963 [Solemya velum]